MVYKFDYKQNDCISFAMDYMCLQYLMVVPILIDFYKEGYLTDEEYQSVEEKLVKKCGINPLSIYRILVEKLK